MHHIRRKVSTVILPAFFCIFIMTLCVAPLVTLASHTSKMSTALSATMQKDISLLASDTTHTLSGTATGTKTIQVYVYKKGSSKVLFKSAKTKVLDGAWSVEISKKLSLGTYDLRVYGVKNGRSKILTRETVAVRDKHIALSTAALSVKSIPLLSGGQARAGTSIPVSYLQVTNGNQGTTSLKGFWIKQNGTALGESVIGLTSIDDKGVFRGFVGGAEGSQVFKGGTAYVPINEVVFDPGQIRLFTIKAVLSRNVAAHIGTQLVLDVTSVDTTATIVSALPVRGVAWTITY